MSDDLKYLFDKVEKIIESPRNLANERFWKSRIAWPRDMWRGFPRLKPSQGIPILVFPDNALWAKFLNCPIEKAFLLNDEVGLPIITPEMYEKFILPYEIELSKFYGGIIYWHSCGDTTNFVRLIKKIPGLKMFHIGPKTDVLKAAQVFTPDVSLDIDLDPFRDVFEADEEKMKEKIEEIVDVCAEKDVPFCIRADAFQPVHTLREDLPRITLWVNIARSTIEKKMCV